MKTSFEETESALDRLRADMAKRENRLLLAITSWSAWPPRCRACLMAVNKGEQRPNHLTARQCLADNGPASGAIDFEARQR